MAATLPTKEELEQLYKDKGREAVVWYAWRNSLRALPILGRLPLKEVWEEDAVMLPKQRAHYLTSGLLLHLLTYVLNKFS